MTARQTKANKRNMWRRFEEITARSGPSFNLISAAAFRAGWLAAMRPLQFPLAWSAASAKRYALPPAWRNWQTRWTQNPVLARVCGFEPLRRHSDVSSETANLAAELCQTSRARARSGIDQDAARWQVCENEIDNGDTQTRKRERTNKNHRNKTSPPQKETSRFTRGWVD